MTGNPSQGAVQCPRCAAQISDPLAAFCPVCGLALSPAAGVPQVASQPPAPPYGQPPAPPYGQPPDSYPGYPGQYPYSQPRSTGISMPILAAVGVVALVVILAVAGLVVVAGRGGASSTGSGALASTGSGAPSTGVGTPPSTMNIAGSWEDMETHDIHVIEWHSDRFVVVSVTDLDDGEESPVTAQSWESGTLTWTYHVVSTGYDVTFVTVSLNGDRLTCQWYGTAGSGTEVLHRVG